MNKIVSNFYLIRLDSEPVYVGYTNRPINTRFKEHLRDKDFGDTEPTVESLGSLEYDFTWDEELINIYAKEVSARETELILAYNTKDTIWQKGTSGNLGGQTWANVKNFVRTNHDNPKFRGLPEEAILALIEYQRKMTAYLKNVISHTKPLEDTRLKNVISHTRPLEDTRLRTVISGTKPLEANRLKNVISNTKPLEYTRLKGVIINTKPLEYTRLKNVINSTKPLEEIRLRNTINNTKPLEEIRLRNTINNTKPLECTRLKNVINSTKPLEATRLKNVITNTKYQVDNKKNI